MRQRISRKSKSAAIVKFEQQQNEVRNLKHTVTTFRHELTKSLARQKQEVKEIKSKMASLHSDVMSEIHDVKQTLQNLLEMQDIRV